MTIPREYSDRWAYDLAFNLNKKGEVHDEDVLNQSIELILGTSYGERFFNPGFGSSLPNRIFDRLDERGGERLLDDVAGAIKRWEDRIIVLEDKMKLTLKPDQNTMILEIPYIIKRDGRIGRFKKKIII